MALTTFALLSVLVIVEGSIEYTDTLVCSKTWFTINLRNETGDLVCVTGALEKYYRFVPNDSNISTKCDFQQPSLIECPRRE